MMKQWMTFSGGMIIAGAVFAITAIMVGPGLGNLTYDTGEVFNNIATLMAAPPGQHGGQGLVSMHKGYLMVITGRDGGGSGGGFTFYDVSDPRSPSEYARIYNTNTHRMREAHAFGFSSNYSQGDLVAVQSVQGIQIWNMTDVVNPVLLFDMVLPGLDFEGDYANAAWGLFWQAPYIYVAGLSQGLYIIDATDPANPVLVNRGANKPNPIPPTALGAIRPRNVFVIGNSLVLGMSKSIGTFNLSDPENPVQQHVISNLPEVYSWGYGNNRAIGAGNDGRAYIYNLSNPASITFEGSSAVIGSKGGYAAYKDGHAFVGASSGVARVRISDRAIVNQYNPGNGDWDFFTPLGNIVHVGSDHGNTGSRLTAYQTGTDNAGPSVEFISPGNNATAQPVTTRIGIAFNEQIDLSSVGTSSFIVRPVGGNPIAGKYSAQQGIVNFFPEVPLIPGTTYEIVLPAGGLQDWVGNSIVSTFAAQFTTAGTPPTGTPPDCVITAPSGGQLVGEEVSFQSSATGTGPLSFQWNFGDGTETSSSSSSSSTHIYSQPGHYIATLTVTNNLGTATATRAVTIHRPLTVQAPRFSSTIAADFSVNRLWVVNSDNNTISAFNSSNNTKLYEVSVGDNPQSIALAPDGTVWVVNKDDATISVLSADNGSLVQTVSLRYASQPVSIVFSPVEPEAYVALYAVGRLVKINALSRTVESELAVGPTPKPLAIDGSGTRLLVGRHISAANVGQVREINPSTFTVTRTFSLARDPGPDTESSGRGVPNYLNGIAISPDGVMAMVASKKDNTERGLFYENNPLVFENTVRTITSELDLVSNTASVVNRIDYDNRDMAFAVDFSPLGDYAFTVTHGTNTVEVVDAYDRSVLTSIHLPGLAPRGVLVSPDGNKLYVQNFMSRTLSVYDLTELMSGVSLNTPSLAQVSAVDTEALPPQILLGKQIFYNAADTRMSRDGYMSCGSCHQDGGHDGRVWDMTQMGEGLRNTTTLLGGGGALHGPVHWTGNFDEIQDFEGQIRALFEGEGFLTNAQFINTSNPLGTQKAGLNADLDALAAYVASLDNVGLSPFRNTSGGLTNAALAGRQIFIDLNCASCHGGTNFSNSTLGNLVDVGTIKASSGNRLGQPLTGLDIPTLRGLWATAPYLHDGAAAGLADVFNAENNPEGLHANTASLTSTELNQLIAYLRQIDDLEISAPVNPNAITISFNSLNPTCHNATDGSITAVVSGATPPYDFQWSDGSTNASLSGLSAGSFTVTVTASNGSSAVATAVLSAPAALSATLVATHPVSGNSGAISLTPSGGTPPYAFLWSNGATVEDLAGVGAGAYVVTLTDAAGCSISEQITLVETGPCAFQESNGSVIIEAENFSENIAQADPLSWQIAEVFPDASDTYMITPDNGTANQNFSNGAKLRYLFQIYSAGTYKVFVRRYATGGAANSVYWGLDNEVQSGTDNGGDYNQWAWVQMGSTSIEAGVHTLELVRREDGYAIDRIVLTTGNAPSGFGPAQSVCGSGNNNCNLTVDIAATSPLCHGDDSGTALATAIEGIMPITYLWNNGDTSASIQNLPVGTYSVTAADAVGCTAQATATLISPPALSLIVTAVNESTPEENDGAVWTAVSGGAPPYTYLWSNAADTAAISMLAPATYFVTVTDANACTTTGSAEVLPASSSQSYRYIRATITDSNDGNRLRINDFEILSSGVAYSISDGLWDNVGSGFPQEKTMDMGAGNGISGIDEVAVNTVFNTARAPRSFIIEGANDSAGPWTLLCSQSNLPASEYISNAINYLSCNIQNRPLQRSSTHSGAPAQQDMQKTEIELQLFPNPAQDRLNILIGSDTPHVSRIQIYNSTGMEVWTKEDGCAPDKVIVVDLPGGQPGVYYLLATDSQGRLVAQGSFVIIR